MWVFGYGSLVWKVDFPFEKKLVGYIKGYVRRFYQHSVDHRGVPEKPGRVVTLLPSSNSESKVWGVAYKIKNQDIDVVTKHLDFREKNGYKRINVQFFPSLAETSNGDDCEPFELCIYVATSENESFAGEADTESIARQIYESEGPSGSNKEYIYMLADAMRQLAPEAKDDHLYTLEAAVRKLDHS